MWKARTRRTVWRRIRQARDSFHSTSGIASWGAPSGPSGKRGWREAAALTPDGILSLRRRREGRLKGAVRRSARRAAQPRGYLLQLLRRNRSDRAAMSISQLPQKLRIILWCTVVSAAIGAVYAEFDVARHGLANFAWYSTPRGALTGALVASVLTSLEVYLLWTPLGSSLRRASFPVHVAVKTLIYLIVIVSALSFGAWAFPAPGEGGIEGSDVLFSLAASFVFVFVMAVNRLLGQNVLLSFVTGRYHKPHLEERVLLFIDMEGSTGLAERPGPLVFHRLLNRFVTDLTDPIVGARGEIYSYVGDEL